MYHRFFRDSFVCHNAVSNDNNVEMYLQYTLDYQVILCIMRTIYSTLYVYVVVHSY